MLRQIRGSRGVGPSLARWADRYSDHVLSEVLVIADPGIAAGGSNINKSVFDDDFDANIRMHNLEAINERREDIDHHGTWDVELEESTYLPLRVGGVLQRRTRFPEKWR